MKNPALKNNFSVLREPRITEKASMLLERGVYVFDVAPSTTKSEIRKVIKSTYKITPVKIAIVQVPSKKVFIRGKKGVKTGGKKAYIYLKKGDKIEIA